MEARSCKECKIWLHYSWRNPDPDKRGKPVITAGQRIRRRRGQDRVDCEYCIKRFAWTQENRAVFRRWRLWLMGVGNAPSACETWAWLHLDDAWQAIDQFIARESKQIVI